MQAKDLADDDVLAVVRRLEADGRWPELESRWVSRWEIEAEFPDAPSKVVLAKLRSLLKRKLIDGCGCGCRGDFHTPEDDQ